MDVLIRVTPGIEAHTHDYITTGQEDSKFGFDLKNGQADEAFQPIVYSFLYHSSRYALSYWFTNF